MAKQCRLSRKCDSLLVATKLTRAPEQLQVRNSKKYGLMKARSIQAIQAVGRQPDARHTNPRWRSSQPQKRAACGAQGVKFWVDKGGKTGELQKRLT